MQKESIHGLWRDAGFTAKQETTGCSHLQGLQEVAENSDGDGIKKGPRRQRS
jgi:hypothetical protein